MQLPFKHKNVLITGAAGGIGRACVLRFAEAGARIIATDFDAEGLSRLQVELNASEHLFVSGDLQQSEFIAELLAQATAGKQNLDVLINNAGVMHRGDALETSDEQWRQTMSVNVDAVFRLSRECLKLMRLQARDDDGIRACIVNLASCWGLAPGPGHLAYCTSKAAVAAMTQCMARDHAPDGIRVNAVCPNEVNTPMLRTGFTVRGLDADDAINQLNKSVPLGRIAEPTDIADVIVYLASREARYLCGALIEANGAKPVG